MKLSIATCGRWAGRLAAWRTPLLLWLLIFAALYLSGDGWDSLYQYPLGHDGESAGKIALADNLSLSRNFLMFLRQYSGSDGAPAYDLYNRFPVGSFALIKLVGLPFGDDLSAKLYASRMLMLLMFSGAAALAYVSLRRITGRPAIALAATLLAFPSYYLLYFSDMVSNEVTMNLFAALLVFHGIAVFAQEGRFGQLLLKTGLALVIGWFVYALLLPFIVFGLGGEIIRAAKGDTFPGVAARIRSIAAVLIRSRYLRLGMFALVLGSALLSFNLANEYAALRGETPLRELPSVQSAIKRTGQNAEYNAASAEYLDWDKFLPGQLRRIGRMALPYVLTVHSDDLHYLHPKGPLNLPYSAIGIAATVACLLGLLFLRRRRMLLAALPLAGLCWGIGMRSNTGVHYIESTFYIGIPLVLFTLILLGLRLWLGRRWGRRLPAVIVAAALGIFVLSTWQHGRVEADLARAPAPGLSAALSSDFPEIRGLRAAAMSDFQEIRRMTPGKRVYVINPEIGPFIAPYLTKTSYIINYYLTGSIIQQGESPIPGCGPECARDYDFVISGNRDLLPTLLTPSNRLAFLFDTNSSGVTAEYRSVRETVVSGGYGEPAARSEFDVYMDGGRLIYHKSRCQPPHAAARFSLHVIPANAEELPPDRQEYGFDNLDFDFRWLGAFLDGDCLAIAPLPDYPIARIRTGQSLRIGDELTQLWRAEFPGNILQHRTAYESIRAGASGGYQKPAARGNFEVYFSDNRLIYLKEQCSAADREAKFYLHLVPQYAADLPDDGQPGFNNLDFWFAEMGAVLDGNCVAIAPLPDYATLGIRTGQFSGASQLWRAELTGERLKHLAASEAIAVYSGRERAARSDWNVYIGDGNRLVYLKESCAALDTDAKFYLHIIPQDVADLPAERREMGFENRDFGFADRGAMLAGQCAVTVALPDYPIARIRTGQHIPGQGELWRADFAAGR